MQADAKNQESRPSFIDEFGQVTLPVSLLPALREGVCRDDGILLESQALGRAMVTDALGARATVAHLKADGQDSPGENPNEPVEKMLEVLKPPEKPADRKHACEVLCLFDGGEPEALARTLLHLNEALKPVGRWVLRFHSRRDPTPWADLVTILARLTAEMPRRQAGQPGIDVHVHGCLTLPSRQLADTFIRNGAHLWLVWKPPIPTLPMPGLLPSEQVMKQLCEFGCRVPVSVYVDRRNGAAIPGVLDRWLRLNQHSGFSLEPACLDPLREPQDEADDPALGPYCELLMRVYREYPYFDDVFSPVATVQAAVDSAPEQYPALRLLVDPQGRVHRFRKIPSRAVPLDGAGPDGVEAALIERELARAGTIPEDDPFVRAECRTCAWRRICGGCEAGPDADGPARADASDLICSVWKLFLQVILWEKYKVHEHAIASTRSARSNAHAG